MEASSGGGAGGRGGGGGGGLARFRSAPVTWLDALLEDDDPLKSASGPTSTGNLTQLLTAGTASSSSSYSLSAAADLAFFDSPGGGGGGPHQHHHQQHNFHRQNSSPAEFLSGNIDGSGGGGGYFSNFAMSGNYDFLAGSQMDAVSPTASGKRMRETDSDLPSQMKGEPSSLMDLEMDKLLEDSVPCRLRAKRGCATHPRSIAERVRRTRISDRIRKLQELVPNMDKQTNTADMLEEAVEYVKRLQMQIEELTELQKKCTCITKE